MRVYFNLAATIIVVIARNGRVTLINRQGCLALGRLEEEIVGCDWFDTFVPEQLRAAVRDAFDRIMAGELVATEYFENPILTPAGERMIAWHNSLLTDEGGRATGALSSGIDITERAHAENALRESEAFAHSILDSLSSQIAVLDDAGVILAVNRAWRDFAIGHARVPADVIEGANYLEACARAEEAGGRDGGIARAFGDGIRQVIAGHRPFFEMKYEAGEPPATLWYIGRVTPCAPPSRGRAVVAHEDITASKRDEAERRQLENQVFHTQKLQSLGLLAGGIAHDFNNLLTSIIGHAELALHRPGPPEEHLHGIRLAARRAAELCHQLLAYAGRGRVAVETIDLPEMIEEMTRVLEVTVPKQVAFVLRFDPDPCRLRADATQLRQAILNLITNAAEAIGPRPGRITLAVGTRFLDRAWIDREVPGQDLSEGRHVFVEVADDGCGMDAETQTRMFDPFFTTKLAGRGLGMAAALGIVRAHAGAIRVKSTPGQGTSITILLPAAESAPEPSAPVPGLVGAWRGSGTLLVVDDEPAIREVASRMLEAIGFDVMTAAGGREALRIYRERGRDIVGVVLDLAMPEMDGAEALRELRRIDPGVRVFISTGYDDEEIARRIDDPMLAGVLHKPYDLARLALDLHRALDPWRGARSRPEPP